MASPSKLANVHNLLSHAPTESAIRFIENCFVSLVCLFEDVSVVSKPDAYFDS